MVDGQSVAIYNDLLGDQPDDLLSVNNFQSLCRFAAKQPRSFPSRHLAVSVGFSPGLAKRLLPVPSLWRLVCALIPELGFSNRPIQSDPPGKRPITCLAGIRSVSSPVPIGFCAAAWDQCSDFPPCAGQFQLAPTRAP